MFDIGWSELLLVGAVALVVIGPKDLPRALKTVGQFTTKLKRMAAEFQSQFNEAMREAELDDIKRSVDSVKDATKSFNPLQKVRDELQTVRNDIRNSVEAKPVDTGSPEPAEFAPGTETQPGDTVVGGTSDTIQASASDSLAAPHPDHPLPPLDLGLAQLPAAPEPAVVLHAANSSAKAAEPSKPEAAKGVPAPAVPAAGAEPPKLPATTLAAQEGQGATPKPAAKSRRKVPNADLTDDRATTARATKPRAAVKPASAMEGDAAVVSSEPARGRKAKIATKAAPKADAPPRETKTASKSGTAPRSRTGSRSGSQPQSGQGGASANAPGTEPSALPVASESVPTGISPVAKPDVPGEGSLT
ncbi:MULTISPECIES: Sec-independent protein translocase protein TatB [unclassified Chelatococcus]|uniref:Sec-independent protein translocase protein TatB n=1 Tax=unclassified Chelatococcus TaxID=2638111 RepID=UPI001BCE7B3C|nr:MULTISPECIES: Sec-independent protein translocase protein TatB [unclassified Chelatococcus]MBS7695709.1 Sec-independent protein translocase protein TatB [Chelatococcus sp. YT9]MBX3557898.1 Sec-independent protein translocase protein TatB [Chelatococcus sp.]